jgi:hypothetical protein
MSSQTSSRRHRTRFSAALLLAVALITLAVFLGFRRGSTRGQLPHLGPVLLHVETYETNTLTDEITAEVAIENQSDQALDFAYGVQIRVAQGWAHTNGNPEQVQTLSDDDSSLPPHARRLVRVARPLGGTPWRAFAVGRQLDAEGKPTGRSVPFFGSEMSP